jgi:hypothetical protein
MTSDAFWIRVVSLASAVVVAGTALYLVIWSGRDDPPVDPPVDPTAVARDRDELERICGAGRRGFGGAPAYGGAGPHAIVVFGPAGTGFTGGHPSFDQHDPDRWNVPKVDTVQLVGCLTPGGPTSAPPWTCEDTAGGTFTLYQGRHRLDVYAVATARPVRTLPIDGSLGCPTGASMGAVQAVQADPPLFGRITLPDYESYTTTLDRLINATVG